MKFNKACTSLHPDGWRFGGSFLVASLILATFSSTLALLGCLLTAWCFYFFRNPRRITPPQPGVIVSPADGIVTNIIQASPPQEYRLSETTHYRISIFLSVFDVHLNRIPLHGTIIEKIYHKGKFFNASLDKASEHNERLTLVVKDDNGINYAVTQIAGLIARRIVCDVQEGQPVTTGQLYGLIRFGSRVDLWLPSNVKPLVLPGQRMVGGETWIACMQDRNR